MNIYEHMQRIFLPESMKISAKDFTDIAFNELTDRDDKRIFLLLKKISTMYVRYKKDEINFSPAYEMADGQRTFALQDLTDEDYALLYSLDINELPKILGLRVADVLWIGKKDYQMAHLSAKLSYELYQMFFDKDNWINCFNFLDHAIGLSARIGSKKLNIYLKEIYEKVIEINGSDSQLLSVFLIELLLSQKWRSFDAILPILDIIIANSGHYIHRAKEAYFLKVRIYNKQNDTQAATDCNRQLAKYLENVADTEVTEDISGLFKAERNYQEAIRLYRNNGAPEEGKRVQAKLIELQKNIPQHMIPITVNVDVIQENARIKDLFAELSLCEKIVRLIQCTPLYKKDFLKEKVLEDAADPLSFLFVSWKKSAQGQNIAEIPPIDLQNPEANHEVLELHMHHKALMLENICGVRFLKRAMDFITAEEEISIEDLRFITMDNPIIPPGRENIFLAGLYYGLVGNLYLALHILTPQVENLFRNIAKLVGGIVSTLNDDNTSDAKLLTSLFEMPELLGCYDNDILFLFKGMMNEKAGANIRNEIAHGIMDEGKGNSGVARFFYCSVLKLLALTSKEFYEIADRIKK